MMRQIRTAVIALLVLTALVGLAYPLVVTGIAQLAFGHRANGSLIENDGVTVGSPLIGQQFTAARYFRARPSAAGDGYDAMASGASNLGPSNPRLLASVEAAARAYRRENGLAAGADVPIDAVTSSGSGLDPQISLANARLQAPRVARARDLPVARVMQLIYGHTEGRSLGFLGEPGVNVLELNLALDDMSRISHVDDVP